MELYEAMCSVTGQRPRITFMPPSPGDVRHSRLENLRAASELHWVPATDLLDGLRATVESAGIVVASRNKLHSDPIR